MAPPKDTPKISIVSFCLNSGRFLRDTIESILSQSYDNYEHIIVDGASTDNTIEILEKYSHLKWISEKEDGDNRTLDALWKGIRMARGEYIVFLAISDGIYDKDWFKRSVKVLDANDQISTVWGLSQTVSEEGHLQKVFWAEYLETPPPQEMDWLPLWLSNGHGFESNAVYRRNVFETCFPKNLPDEPYRFHSTLGFNYQFNVMGYLPYFLPVISYYGRTHKNQMQQKHHDLLDSVSKIYDKNRKLFRKNFLSGKVKHYFRDGFSNIIKEVTPDELGSYKRKVWKCRLKLKIKRDVQKFLDHI